METLESLCFAGDVVLLVSSDHELRCELSRSSSVGAWCRAAAIPHPNESAAVGQVSDKDASWVPPFFGFGAHSTDPGAHLQLN